MKEMIAAISLLYSIPIHRIVSLKDDKVFLVQSKKDRFVLKLLPYPAMETAFITDAMSYLSQNGFHDFNELIPTAKGQLWGRFREQCTLLTKEIHGRIPSYKKIEDIRVIAAYLGELHCAAAHFFPIHRYDQRIKWGTMIDTMKKSRSDLITFRQRAKEKTEPDHFDKSYLHQCNYYIEETEKAIEKMSQFYPLLIAEKRRFGGFCHHDPAYHNFLIQNNGRVGAFDFDYAIADLCAHDVAALMLKVLKTNHWEAAPALHCLSSYMKTNPLDHEELRFIYWLLVYPYDFHHAAFARYSEDNRQHRIEKKLFRWEREKEKREELLRTIRPYLLEEP
ncbi:MAG: CotS family spore coat protein [Firmicutes bacterium]|nr:CotS family spore coat protein [Bacillota bacterium]